MIVQSEESLRLALATFEAELVCTREIPTTKSRRNAPDPEVLLAALVIGKTLIDLTLHRRSNRAG